MAPTAVQATVPLPRVRMVPEGPERSGGASRAWSATTRDPRFSEHLRSRSHYVARHVVPRAERRRELAPSTEDAIGRADIPQNTSAPGRLLSRPSSLRICGELYGLRASNNIFLNVSSDSGLVGDNSEAARRRSRGGHPVGPVSRTDEQLGQVRCHLVLRWLGGAARTTVVPKRDRSHTESETFRRPPGFRFRGTQLLITSGQL